MNIYRVKLLVGIREEVFHVLSETATEAIEKSITSVTEETDMNIDVLTVEKIIADILI